MWVQPLRTAETRQWGARGPAVEQRVAVLLNANARRVTDRVVRSLSHIVAPEDLYVSRSELDARRIAQAVVERRYDTVFCGGGDGTFMGFVSEILNVIDHRKPNAPPVPRFGILKLGTGNSVATWVRASSSRGEGFLDDVLRAKTGEVPVYRRMDLLEVDGRRAPFAGLGVDGKVLNDYVWVKQNLAKGMLRHALTGPGGYLTSVALKTVPHYLSQSSWVECEVINGSRSVAYRLNSDGAPTGEPIPPGERMFSGPLMMAAAGTVPYYGYAFRMFPFAARRRGMMHLRLAALSTGHVLTHLPKLWQGRYFPEGVHDFHAQEVTIRFQRPMPLQVAGDGAGYRSEVTVKVAREPIELVDFNGALH